MRTRIGIFVATIALAGLSTVGFAGIGVSDPSNAGLPALVVVPTEVAPGATFTVSGSGCTNLGGESIDATDIVSPVVTLSVAFAPTPVGPIAVPVAGDGTWSQVVTVPADALPGAYTVSATCDDGVPDDAGVEAAATAEYPSGTVTITAVAAQAVPAQPRTAG